MYLGLYKDRELTEPFLIYEGEDIPEDCFVGISHVDMDIWQDRLRAFSDKGIYLYLENNPDVGTILIGFDILSGIDGAVRVDLRRLLRKASFGEDKFWISAHTIEHYTQGNY